LGSSPSVTTSGPRNARAESLLTGIVDMARRLNVACVAEGIADAHQLAVLRDIGCAYGQGYHFSEPMPVADLRALLEVAGGLAPGAARGRTAPATSSPRRRIFARAPSRILLTRRPGPCVGGWSVIAQGDTSERPASQSAVPPLR